MKNIMALALLSMAAPGIAEPAMHHATGTFSVAMTPAADTGGNGVAMARVAIAKTFEGEFVGTSKGEMLTAGDPATGSAAYVFMEHMSGTIAGKSGDFVLMHSATMDHGKLDQHIVVVPGSGTGGMAGISGAMTIRIEAGKHVYDLAYDIVPAH